jgi:hypothetical protein
MKILLEYHHHIGKPRSCLADFLRQLQQAGFEYQFSAAYPVDSKGVFQNISITAYR